MVPVLGWLSLLGLLFNITESSEEDLDPRFFPVLYDRHR